MEHMDKGTPQCHPPPHRNKASLGDYEPPWSHDPFITQNAEQQKWFDHFEIANDFWNALKPLKGL